MTPGEGPGGLSALPVSTTGPSGNSGKRLRPETFQGMTDTPPSHPAGRRPTLDSPMADRLPQSLLWKSLQALALQCLPQVRTL